MPGIRDYASNATTAATGTTLVIPVPTVVENDLLVAILVADTATTETWSSPGWTVLFQNANTSGLAVLYKLAVASEAADYTFTRSASESFNGRMISIRDVNITYPFGNPAVFTAANQAAAAKYALPQVTTTVANSLVLYAVSNSVLGVPSIIEGPATLISGEDGVAESGGDAWTFMPSTGASPSNVTCSNVLATGIGVKAAIQIAPPASGATVIPTYCAADSSQYVDPIHGVTAYNANAALAVTFDTLIGTLINAVTLADAGVAAIADVGINSYHSAGRVTSITGSKNWAGVAIDLAAANLLTTAAGKNILVHTGPSTPGQIQRFPSAAGRKGTLVALATSFGNFKAWHVHGRGTPYGYQRDVPLIVNTDNTSGLLQTTGTFDPASIDVIGFATSGSGITTTIWDFYSLWVLDTVTICGGIAAEPMDIPGIVRAAADGHERKSIVQQGANQAIIFQPIQIGNGGTNPVYLDLNSTAIEFPRQYDLAKLQVNYCSVDNVAGITYYAGAGDTIKHRNSVISSPSRYHWRLHASSSTSATYDFSGLSVIGAGTITLANAITITGLTINNYSTIDASSLTLNSSTITNVPTANNSITLNTTTAFNSCSINVTTLTAGNYLLSTATPNKFANCTFTGSASSGHAMRLTAIGTFSLVGNTFTSFGADATTSAAIFNDSGSAITLNISGGGTAPTIRNGAGASTTVVASVDLTIHVENTSQAAIENARVYVTRDSDSSVIINGTLTNSSGNATGSTVSGAGGVTIRVRKSSAGTTRYVPVQATGTVGSSNLTVNVTMSQDTIASA